MSSETDLNPNKIVADMFSTLVKDSLKAAAAPVSHVIRKLIEIYQKDMRDYISATIHRCSYIKTLLHKDEPVLLLSLYVMTRLKLKKKIITDEQFIAQLPQKKSVVVCGTAGSGKSMFMRYLFLSLCNNPGTQIPLFIELRQMNSLQSQLLLPFIHHSVTAPGANLTQEQFEDGLKKGLFILLLDGFDEIDFDQRKSLADQILEMREKFPDTLIVISSRPDDTFDSWSHFSVFTVEPMEKKQVIALIRKLNYDKAIATKFIKQLDTKLFRTHGSFLSNPLLAIMMLITFDQYAHIPDKIHIFYEQAFDALFYRHDASKPGAYKRKTYTGLPIDDFRNCLSSFCMGTYAKEKFLLSAAEVRAYLTKAFEFENKKIDPDLFLRDLLECVCVLQRDGLFLTFSHRSFQEYFSAVFITRNPGAFLPGLLDQISKRNQDSTIPMSFEMNRQLIEGAWIIPRLRAAIGASGRNDPAENPIEYIDDLFGGLRASIDQSQVNYMYASQTSMVNIMGVFHQLYSVKFASLNSVFDMQADSKILKDSALTKREKESETSQAHYLGVRFEASDNDLFRRLSVCKFFVARDKVYRGLLKELSEKNEKQNTILGGLFT